MLRRPPAVLRNVWKSALAALLMGAAAWLVNRVLAGLEVRSVQAGPENHNSVLRPLMNGVLRVDPAGNGPSR